MLGAAGEAQFLEKSEQFHQHQPLCLPVSTLRFSKCPRGCLLPFFPVSIAALCVKCCTSHRAWQPHKYHLSPGWSNYASVRQGGGMAVKVVWQPGEVTQGMFPPGPCIFAAVADVAC